MALKEGLYNVLSALLLALVTKRTENSIHIISVISIPSSYIDAVQRI